jgi:geranylgeranyl diphosphate synthase type I
MERQEFLDKLRECGRTTDACLRNSAYRDEFGPEPLREAALAYVGRGGKRLRPAVLMMCCGAAGGDPQAVEPAAAAIELFHTWTLVHDDIIDNDATRRGEPTAHILAAAHAGRQGYGEADSVRFGRDTAILAGDILQGWSTAMLLDCARDPRCPPAVVLALAAQMEGRIVPRLIRGEMLDVCFAGQSPERLTEAEVLEMLRLKTGVLMEFAAVAGACLGNGRLPDDNPLASLLGEFAWRCGIAFQLQDDILGIIGDEKQLGKPVGSDVREGKRTVILLHALAQAAPAARIRLLDAFGNPILPITELAWVRETLERLGSFDYARQLAEAQLASARHALAKVPASSYRDWLEAWADFMVKREF